MESLINYQEDISTRLNKAFSNFKKSPKERISKEYVEGRLESLDHLWSEFLSGHKELLRSIEPKILKESSYIGNDLYDATQDVYFEYKGILKKRLSKFKEIEVNEAGTSASQLLTSAVKQSQVKLPKICIPIFTGVYTEWPTFRDLFKSLVHNNEVLDKVQKLHYLKGHVSGEAEQLIRYIPVAESNYDRCWSLLKSRYDNKKYISHNILKRMLSQRNCLTESANHLKELIDTTTECLEALTALGIDVTTWDIIVIHIIALKLDPESRRQWEFNITSIANSDSLPTFKQFREFITNRFRALEYIETKTSKPPTRETRNYYAIEEKVKACLYCSADHSLAYCKKFSGENIDTRRNFVQENGICFNCLGKNHSAKFCKSNSKCRICKGRHHSLLHPKGVSASTATVGCETLSDDEDDGMQKQIIGNSNDSDTHEPFISCCSLGQSRNTVLLTTALIDAETKYGGYTLIRALLDQGSQASFITESTAQFLGLKKTPSKNLVKGVGGGKEIISKAIVTLKIKSRTESKFEITVKAYVLKTITTLLPVVNTTKVKWEQAIENNLADPEYYTPNKINILLGAEVYAKIIKEGVKKNTGGLLVAQDTKLGWIISGISRTLEYTSVNITSIHAQVESENLLKRFWELEAEPLNQKKILTQEEQKCEDYYKKTTKRNKEGRYIVRLPFREKIPRVAHGNSRTIAERRFKSLELKLKRSESIKEDYNKVISEYIELGHMKRVNDTEKQKGDAVYLPHHAIILNDKDTTKLRVVFDASCKGSNRVSLNDDLMIGPTLQDDLRHLIMRWRIPAICISADIIKMYRQINVHKEDATYQRVLWRDDPETNIEDYELTTVTFGTASAPYLAVKTLQQISHDEGWQYPLASQRVIRDFYMDDLMTGVETEDEGIKLYEEMNELLEKGGFKLQKWSSNSDTLLNRMIGKEGQKRDGVQFKLDSVIKILGLTWNRSLDAFRYKVTLPPMEKPATKRSILSDISRLYDPLGWVAPCIIIAKVLIQKLWLAGLNWDEEVPKQILEEWQTYREELLLLTEIYIPRWFKVRPDCTKSQLHGFCDASKVAYAAVLYLRTVDSNNNVHVALVTSKTKVAPIKQISIPRMELCGAVLLAKLMVEVGKVMGIDSHNQFAWTDSEVVLAWLKGHPGRWNTFVGNRVSEILSTLELHRWAHVKSHQNPADCASRGVRPAELCKANIWFDGPTFLKQDTFSFARPKNVDTNLEEVVFQNHAAVVDLDLWYKFSNLNKLLRVIAYCRRFLTLKHNATSTNVNSKYLQVHELNEAMNICIIKCQKEEFEEELENLRRTGNTNKFIKGRNKLKSLNVFFDSDNILRVGGRLEKSNLSYDLKHPIVIPKSSFLTTLLLNEAHLKTLHGGPQLMLNYIGTRFWLLGAKSLAKQHFRQCVVCAKNCAVTRNQLMGQLPTARLNISKPFSHSGVDYAGPINIRTSKGRGYRSHKGYICLFVCMATRAIHLEAVSDLTAHGFLAAFRRFVARRGSCSDLYSDNGTNFVGADRELRHLVDTEKYGVATDIADWLATNGTNWHFMPPHAPNFGGLWEAGIKSTKYHLKRIIGTSTLTYEEMVTVLAQIEACLNSRPISKVKDDVNDEMALTPGHFLVGQPLISVPDRNYEKYNVSNLRRWQLTQRMVQHFWRRWSDEYLRQFLHRYKWSQQNPEPNIGDLVLVKENDLPPSRWLLGIVVEKHPGVDGITRVVTLRVKNSLLKRPTSKLCILPVTK